MNVFNNGPDSTDANSSIYLNWDNTGSHQIAKSDIHQVPDGGLTVGLLGLALVGVVALRRKFGQG